jgi:TPP-dependent 2-oxoacid decarboxylase
LGVEHLFGVPGDFDLTPLDLIAAEGGQTWLALPNELDAGYAADGYARTRGLGAVITTLGVGELSCINAIAGSYAENVPVVQITRAPATAHADRGSVQHHTLADGDFDRFQRAYREVTGRRPGSGRPAGAGPRARAGRPSAGGGVPGSGTAAAR